MRRGVGALVQSISLLSGEVRASHWSRRPVESARRDDGAPARSSASTSRWAASTGASSATMPVIRFTTRREHPRWRAPRQVSSPARASSRSRVRPRCCRSRSPAPARSRGPAARRTAADHAHDAGWLRHAEVEERARDRIGGSGDLGQLVAQPAYQTRRSTAASTLAVASSRLVPSLEATSSANCERRPSSISATR